MKKFLCIILVFLNITLLFCGCNYKKEDLSADIKIVTTTFSSYDWTKNVLGDMLSQADLILVSDNGVDMHSYQPTADDIINVKTADLVIYTGSESDKWLDDVLSDNKNIMSINMMELLKDKLLYTNEDSHQHDGHSHNKQSADEHIWLSLRNAVCVSKDIYEKLSQLDPQNSKKYFDNFKSFSDRLIKLDENYSKKFNSVTEKVLVFADRFPFRYTVADYSLQYKALFEGCSSESDTTVDAVLELSKTVERLSLRYIFIIDKQSEKTAKSVIDNSNTRHTEILQLNSMQLVNSKDLKEQSYINVMENNLSLIYKALR